MRLSRCVWAGAALGVVSMFAGFANANEIFSEDFASNDGAVGSLDGTAEDTSGAIWAANGFATANGILNTGQFEGSATLATTLLADYTYSVQIDVTSDSDDWFGVGFSENGSTSVLNRPQDRFAQSFGRSWFLYRPEESPLSDQVQIFGGANTDNPIADIDTNYSGALTTRTLEVILNTDSAGFTADFLIDGVSQTAAGGAVGVPGTLADFAHVGFTFEGPGGAAGGGISVANFSFSGKSNAIPEPSSLALLGLVSVTGLARRRRS